MIYLYLKDPGIYYYHYGKFFTPVLADSLSLDYERQSHQVSWTFLSLLADPNYAVVWEVSARSLISNSFRPSAKPLGIVSSAPTTISITVNFIFHRSFSSLTKSK